jgi:hypothetical protein
MLPDEKNTQTRPTAHLIKDITDQALHIGMMRDPSESRERLHTLFFTYVLHVLSEGVQEEEHQDICSLYLEIRGLLGAIEAYQQRIQIQPN